jgi:hypothetical protein
MILRERRRQVTIEAPDALLPEAVHEPTAREAIGMRLKMLFPTPPTPLPKYIAIAPRRAGCSASDEGAAGPRRR